MHRFLSSLFLAGVISSGASWALAGWRGAVCWLLGVAMCGIVVALTVYELVNEERR